MNMMEELRTLGVNTDEALARFMNNESLYERMVKKFVPTAEGLPVLPLIESGDIEQAQNNAHTLKGVTGNLSLTPLYAAYSDIMTLFRAGQIEEAKQKLLETIPVQEQIVACIEKYQ